MKELDRAKSQLSEAFCRADPASQRALDRALSAFELHDYRQAVVGLLALGKTSNRSFEQWQLYYGVYMGLERDIISGIQAGDVNAGEAARLMRELPCCVH